MTVVEGVEYRRGAVSKTVPTPSPPGTPCCVEPQQVIGASFQDPVGDRLLAAHGVTMPFFKDSVSSSAGIAVISFDLPSAGRPCSLALTKCTWARSNERRSVLPSIATTSRSKVSAKDWAQALKQASKASISLKTRRKVSCEGMPLNERLRRGGSKQRLGLEAPNYLVVRIRKSVLKKTTLTPLRPGVIDALTLALQPSEPLSSRTTRLWNGTLKRAVHLAPDVSVVPRTAARLGHSDGDQLGIAFVAIWPLCK
jgi:hypothetical protein